MTESGRFVEIQGTGEEATFNDDELNALILHGKAGIAELIAYQKEALFEAVEIEEKQS